MRGIICKTKTEFKELDKKIHSAMQKNLKDYQAERWLDVNKAQVHQTTGEFLFPVKDGERGEIIEKALTTAQIKQIIEVEPGDKDWFVEDDV